MAILKGNFTSRTLQMMTGITVVLPNKQDDTAMKVIYLLHGLSDNADAWPDNTMLAVYSNLYNVAFVCPEVQRSFYADMDFGLNYFTYIADELPQLVKQYFNVSTERSDTAIMGLSMGGYGALKVALMRPDRFHLCGAFSSAIDPLRKMIAQNTDPADVPAEHKEWIGVFGHRSEAIRGENLQDLVHEIVETKQRDEIPTIHLTCGKQDFLYEENVAFKDFMADKDVDFHYFEKDGVHDWFFWNDSLKLMLDTYYKPSEDK